MSFCRNCGAPLPPDAQFCPRCGTAVVDPAHETVAAPAPVAPPSAQPAPPPNVERVQPPPAQAAPAPSRRRRGGGSWWIVPLVIVGIIVIAWIVLASMPLGRDTATNPPVETVTEGTAPRETATLVDIPDPAQRAGANPSVTIPPAQVATEPRVTGATEPPPEAGPGEMSEAAAGVRLSNYITERDYYEIADECVQVRGLGYKNAGYTFEVWHNCRGGGGQPRLLGRWRVDSERGEIFRQRPDGRYLEP